jgi:flagellar assembly protein FliH
MMTWSSDWTVLPASDPGPALAAWTPQDLTATPLRNGGQGGASSPARGRDPESQKRAEEARALAERQAELDEAFDRGFEEGRAEAARVERDRVDSALRALEMAMDAIRAARAPWTQDAREHICALAVAVARHVIGRELRGDAHAIAELTRQALTEFPTEEAVRVRMHPQDLSVLTAATSPAGGTIRVAPGREVQWIADPDILPGGCIVEGPTRVVDGRIDHALERIYQKLTDD